jgi:prevent-host-death family protein
MSSREARKNFGTLIRSVHSTNEPVIVERKGKPYAVVISSDQYEQWRQDRAARLWQTVARVQQRHAKEDPDEIYRAVSEVVEQVRQERYERAEAAKRGR